MMIMMRVHQCKQFKEEEGNSCDHRAVENSFVDQNRRKEMMKTMMMTTKTTNPSCLSLEVVVKPSWEAKCCAMKLPMQCSSQDSHDFSIVGIKAIKNRIGQGCGRVQGQIFVTSNEATMSKGQAPSEEGSSHSLRQTVVVIEGIQNCRSTSVNLLAIIPRAWLGKQIAKHNGFEFAMCGLVWNMGGQGLDPRGLGARVPLGEI